MMDQPPPYAPAPGPGFGSAPGFPGYQSYPAQPFYYQGSTPGPSGPSWPYTSAPGGQDLPTAWDTPKNTVYLMKQEEHSSLPGFGSGFGSGLSGLGSGFRPGLGHGFGGGLKSFLGACSAALCCCCLWDLLNR